MDALGHATVLNGIGLTWQGKMKSESKLDGVPLQGVKEPQPGRIVQPFMNDPTGYMYVEEEGNGMKIRNACNLKEFKVNHKGR